MKMHSPFGYSAVSTYEQCPYRYKLQYVENITTVPDYGANNALTLGAALHIGMECGMDEMISSYYGHYPMITTEHVNEVIKLKDAIEKLRHVTPTGEHEVTIRYDEFIGTIDLITGENIVDLYDFKYASENASYKESSQLHIYAYYLMKVRPSVRIGKLHYLIAPKTYIRQKKSENVSQFRTRLSEELKGKQPIVVELSYDEQKVRRYLTLCEEIRSADEYPRRPSRLCDWCTYQNYCIRGDDTDIVV